MQDAKDMHMMLASPNFGLLDRGDIMSGCSVDFRRMCKIAKRDYISFVMPVRSPACLSA